MRQLLPGDESRGCDGVPCRRPTAGEAGEEGGCRGRASLRGAGGGYEGGKHGFLPEADSELMLPEYAAS